MKLVLNGGQFGVIRRRNRDFDKAVHQPIEINLDRLNLFLLVLLLIFVFVLIFLFIFVLLLLVLFFFLFDAFGIGVATRSKWQRSVGLQSEHAGQRSFIDNEPRLKLVEERIDVTIR